MTDNVVVDAFMTRFPIISNMVTHAHVEQVLSHLVDVLDDEVEGDVVELGCNVGTTSLFIRRMLDHRHSDKVFHVYDSFEGLPEKDEMDESSHVNQYDKGSCTTSIDIFKDNFKREALEVPKTHIGWFKEIPDDEYPDKIAFAFFDGDFYTSILDSFEKTYDRLAVGAKVVIHDYGWEALPGVKQACDEFLADRPEKMIKIEGISLGLLVKQ